MTWSNNYNDNQIVTLYHLRKKNILMLKFGIQLVKILTI